MHAVTTMYKQEYIKKWTKSIKVVFEFDEIMDSKNKNKNNNNNNNQLPFLELRS